MTRAAQRRVAPATRLRTATFAVALAPGVRAAVFALAIPAVLAVALGLGSAAPRPPEPRRGVHGPRAHIERARVLMGTTCTVTVEAADSAAGVAAANAALDEIARLEQVMSSWRSDSELSQLNAGGAETRLACSADLYAVIDSAFAIARATGGAFDPTVEPLIRAWDLRGEGHVPSESELADARALVGWPMVQLEARLRTVRFQRPGMGLDLGGIGKGFALDRAVDELRGRGVKRALINLGGEVAAFSDGDPWRVQVADPSDRLRPLAGLMVRQAAVSTSGQQERGFSFERRHYGHVLDPRRGLPLETRATVTVVCASATRADGLSTALLVMGRDRAELFARDHPDLGVLWLEPSSEGVLAWRWNFAGFTAEPGASFRWMN